ncbi:hypothetical protein PWT90_07888 [Aphanocladium album]|nr:hypothetical protein PWT90_07888 [Aphanocladium album]
MDTPTRGYNALPMRKRDYISLLLKFPVILCSFGASLLARCWWPHHSLYALHWRQKLAMALMQSITKTMNLHQLDLLVALRKTSAVQIVSYCAANGLEHRQVDVQFPAANPQFPSPSLHIVTPPDTNPEGPTLFYAHGGGYQSPMRAGSHVRLALYMASACRAARVVFLAYSYTPAARYPGQLVQAVEGLRCLMDEEGSDPADIVLAGDSAGGHLVASVLLHLQRPAPGIAPLELNGRRFRAAVLLSPWLLMGQGRKEVTVDTPYDFLRAGHVQHFTDLFQPDREHVWACPVEGPSAKSLWSQAVGPSGVVDRLLTTAGDAELLFDSCRIFMTEYVGGQTVVANSSAKITDLKATIQGATAVFAIGPREVHVQPGLDAYMGYYGGSSMTAITCFLETVS